MRDYSLEEDMDDFDEDEWLKEPEETIKIGNLQLDKEAAERYNEIRKARERRERGPYIED